MEILFSQILHKRVSLSVNKEERLKGWLILIMPTSPVKTRIPLTSFGHLVTEVKKQLFGMEAPVSAEFTGWRKYFNSYTPRGRRNCVLATYSMLVVGAAVFLMQKRNRREEVTSGPTAWRKETSRSRSNVKKKKRKRHSTTSDMDTILTGISTSLINLLYYILCELFVSIFSGRHGIVLQWNGQDVHKMSMFQSSRCAVA